MEQAGLENLAIEQILRNAALQQQQRRAAAEQALHQLAVMIQFSQHAPLNRTRSAPPPGTASRADDIATLAGLMSVQRASPLHNLPPFFQERLQRQTSRHENTATVNMMLQALIYGRTSQLGELSIPAQPIAVSSQSHPTPSFASASSATAANITDQGQQRLLRILEEMNRSRVRRQAITQLFLQQRR